MADDAPEPPALAFPPTIDPARWGDFPAFRETLLLHYSNPEYNAALRAVGLLLHEVALESGINAVFPDLPGLFTRHELAAVVADLRYLQGFLTMVGEEQEDADARDPDKADLVRLSRLAASLVGQVARIAAAIEAALARESES